MDFPFHVKQIVEMLKDFVGKFLVSRETIKKSNYVPRI